MFYPLPAMFDLNFYNNNVNNNNNNNIIVSHSVKFDGNFLISLFCATILPRILVPECYKICRCRLVLFKCQINIADINQTIQLCA